MAEIFRKYKFLALPVVDAGAPDPGDLITLKDIMQKHIEE